MESFQCSPLATADGILGMFRRCAKYQKDKDNFVSVVVLDEVGLAEDSPKMPLKVRQMEEGPAELPLFHALDAITWFLYPLLCYIVQWNPPW